MNNIRPFRYWCQKVLPLVYDDSLSYYELLCKVVAKLNEVIDNENDLNEAFKQLKEWVENWFDSTDFEEMVSNKLDEMVVDGTLENLINKKILGSIQSHLTSAFINVVHEGAKNDGTETAEILNQIFNKYPSATFYFPGGTYLLETSLNINSNNRVAIYLDGGVLKANGAFPVLILGGESTDEKNAPIIYGNGYIDMNNIATVGIQINDNSRYAKIKEISIENIGQGTGIKLGEEGASLSTVIDGITIRGTGSYNADSVGIEIIGYDSFFSNVNIIRVYTGMNVNSGGNMFNNVHIWSDLGVNNSNWSDSVGINNNFINNMYSNIYLDNYGIGVRAIQPTSVKNIYYYLPYEGTGDNIGVVIQTPQNNTVNIDGIYAVKKAGFTTKIVNIPNQTKEYLLCSNHGIKVEGVIYDNTGFNPFDEYFNICNHKYTKQLAKNMQESSLSGAFLLGYIKDGTSVHNIRLQYGGAWEYLITIKN